MIKFFRHIRQRMLTENKFSKYMIYAIGEIILVVIGILIALSINTWNQERLASHKEDIYLDNLETDLENQIASIDIQLSSERMYESAAEPLLRNFERELKMTIDSASAQSLMTLTERKTFVKTDPTYQDLISTGNIGLIKNDKLRKELLEYYLELERFEKILQNNNSKHVDEMFVQNIVQSVYIGSSSQKLYEISNELMKDPEREMVLINQIDYRTKIAALHIKFMNELRVKTVAMLDSLKRSRS